MNPHERQYCPTCGCWEGQFHRPGCPEEVTQIDLLGEAQIWLWLANRTRRVRYARKGKPACARCGKETDPAAETAPKSNREIPENLRLSPLCEDCHGAISVFVEWAKKEEQGEN